MARRRNKPCPGGFLVLQFVLVMVVVGAVALVGLSYLYSRAV